MRAITDRDILDESARDVSTDYGVWCVGTMAEETIYLCNFRVSVNGDWLCLKELTDVNLDLRLAPLSDECNPAAIERANLLIVCKLVIKEVIGSSLKHGRMLDDEHAPLRQFFIVLEHVLRHRIKPKKGILRDRREMWSLLEQVERYIPDATDITISVKEMSHIKSAVGRGRAWLRLALMQKRLADYFRVLIDNSEEVLREYYEDGAIMLDDEGDEIAGLLVGLNVIDFNMAIKDKDLDQPLGVIDFSLYLQDRITIQSPEDESQGQVKMAAILDQKNYLEELNRHLNATVTNLQQKLESTQTANTLMKEDLAIAKNTTLELQQQNMELYSDKTRLASDYQKQIQTAKVDLDTERETYETSRNGLDTMYQDMQKKLREETGVRLDVEKEMELQIGMKQEVEMAMRLLEKDIHEKQDSIFILRKQLDDIKAINLEMYNKLKSCEGSLQHKTELVSKLEEKSSQMAVAIAEMEDRLKQWYSDKLAAEETSRKLGQLLVEKDAKRSALETDLKIEREWRGTLQRNLDQEKERVAGLQEDVGLLHMMKKEFHALQAKHVELQTTCDERSKALYELGCHLSESKLKVEDMKELHAVNREAQWAEDKVVAECRQCERPFSVSRRKHHCRSCGEIFCKDCSDTKMALPSSAKPERVCDSCHALLLQRYSAN